MIFWKSIVGPDLVKKTFWFFATIFIFILFTNWFGLIPGVGTIGWGAHTAHGFEVTRPLLRGGNADLNMTFAMAVIFMLLWFVWALQSNGLWGFFLHIFGPKGDSTARSNTMMIVFFLPSVSWRSLHCVPSDFAQLPSLRQYVCGGKPAGCHVAHRSTSALGQGRVQRVAAGAVLFSGIAGRFCPGPCFHAFDGGVYRRDMPARRRGARKGASLKIDNFGGLTVFNRGSRRTDKKT